MAKNKLEETLKACRALNEEEFNLSQGDQIEIQDDYVEDQVVEPIVDPDFEDEGMDAKSYVNKNVIFCNICLKPFFSDEEVSETTVCPTCSASYEDLELVGKVVTPEATEPAAEEGEGEGEEVPAEEIPSEEEEIIADESVNKEGNAVNEDVTVTVTSDDVNVDVDTANADVKVSDANAAVEPVAEPEEDEFTAPVVDEFEYQEESFNKLFTKFLTDNYKNVKAFNVVEARLKSEGLVLEGVITFENDNARNIRITTDAMELKEGVSKVKAACPLFGKAKAFVVEHIVKENKISATKLNYRFRTRANNEAYDVVGRVILENA